MNLKMKSKILFFGLLALAFASCDDDINSVGSTIQPPGDVIPTYVDSFVVTTKTVHIDSLYAKTSQALLGEFTDPLFGTMKAEYMCQFYCKDNFKFKYSPIDGKIDSIDFKLVYNDAALGGVSGWVGDSLAPQQVQVYKITSPLTEDFYTNIDPKKYCDMSQMLGSKVFTAIDKSVPDSIRFDTNNGYYTYTPHVTIELPKELGQQIYDATLNAPENFKDQDAFNNYFKGLYITTNENIGSGCVLKVGGSGMYIYYKYNETLTSKVDGSDSIVVRNTAEVFQVTPEIIQLSHLKNWDMDKLLENPVNNRISYLKSPAGIYTQITFPIKEMAKKLGTDRTITNFPFSLHFLPQDKWKYALAPPNQVLLIPKDSLQSFFREGRVHNNISTFLSTNYIKSTTSYYETIYTNTYMYDFKNLSTFLQDRLKNAPDQDVDMLVVPVSPITTSVGSGYYQQSITTRINNYFEPSGVKLITDPHARQIGIRSAQINSTKK